MRVKHKAHFINNNILASRYVADMNTFGFVLNERGRHQFRLKLIRFWLYIYSLNALNRLFLNEIIKCDLAYGFFFPLKTQFYKSV